MNCPHCHARDAQAQPHPHAVDGSHIHAPGIVLTLLHQYSRPTCYHCPTCGKEFSKRSVSAQLCLLLFIITLASGLGFVAWVWTKSLITP